MKLHWAIADASGRSVVVEYLEALSRHSYTWTPKVRKIMAFLAMSGGFGTLSYILLKHIHVFVHMQAHPYVYAHVYVYAEMCAYAYVCTCAFVYVCIHVYVYVYVYGMVWYGMVWYGMVWYGMVWYGMVWNVM